MNHIQQEQSRTRFITTFKIMEPQNFNNDNNNYGYYSSSSLQSAKLLLAPHKLSYILLLTGCLAGVQFTWTVELAYGTPYLLSLGLAKSLLALVWLAGPLSGLIIQPLIGIFSDKCYSPYGRRRPFIIGSGIIVALSIIMIAYSKEFAMFLSFKSDERDPTVNNITILIAIFAFYFLDFSINAVQASCRALIVDVSASHQQDSANAWAGRMIGVGNVIGFLMGFVDLPTYFPFFGSSQLEVLCILALITFTLTIALTCICIHEEPLSRSYEDTVSLLEEREKEEALKWFTPLIQIFQSIKYSPKMIKQICHVQFFAWIGWFPLLFYSTSWVSSKGMTASNDGVDEEGTRIGSLAMLAFAIISVLTGFILPMIAIREQDFHEMRLSLAKKYLKIPVLWTMSLWFFSFLMFCTWFVHDRTGAVIIVGLAGISWGATQWIPFTLLGEYIAYLSDLKEEQDDIEPGSTYEQVPPEELIDENLIFNHRTNSSNSATSNNLSAGLVLGIHNVYIVLPQFVSTFVCAVVFYMLGENPDHPRTHPTSSSSSPITSNESHSDSFGMVLRLGGLSSILAGFMALKVKELSRKRDC